MLHLRILVIAWLLVSLGACAASRLPDYPTLSTTSHGESKSERGVTVAVRMLTDRRETQEYFGTDLLAADILAIHVLVENKSPTANYLIVKDQIKLLGGAPDITGRPKVGDSGLGSTAAGTVVVGVAVAPLIAAMFIPIAVGMESNAAEIRRNFAAKELHQEVVAPGAMKQGFLYFQLPKERHHPMNVVVHVTLLDPVADTTISLDFPCQI